MQKYVKDKYDRVVLTMPKGKKETVQAHAACDSMSVNAYIDAAIDEKMERDGSGKERKHGAGQRRNRATEPKYQ